MAICPYCVRKLKNLSDNPQVIGETVGEKVSTKSRYLLLFKIFGIESVQLIGGDAYGGHSAEHLMQFVAEDLLAAHVGDYPIGAFSHEESQASLIVDYTALLQIVVAASHGVGVNFHRCGKFSYRGDALVGLIHPSQDFIADVLGYLQIYGFVVLKIHSNNSN